MRRHIVLNALILLPMLGCGDARESNVKTAERVSVSAPGSAARSEAPHPPSHTGADKSSAMIGRHGGGDGHGVYKAPVDTAALSRKIIYDGEIDLIVKDVDPIGKQVVTFIQDARGYIAEQSTTGSPGSQRAMRWKLRVPVEQFESLVQKVVALGELERNTRTSQDVTEQFYDIEARIKNKKAEEKSLTKILDERTGKLEDVLKIETELSRVRGEIEQLEGKIRVLENLSSLATLILNVREREKFEPPAAGRGRLSHPGRADLGELDPRPDQPRKSGHPLGRRLGALDPAPDRRRPPGLDHPPPADPASSPADRPGQHADHAAADSVSGRGCSG